MSRHVDSDDLEALGVRTEILGKLVERDRDDPAVSRFIPAIQTMRHSPVYVWTRAAMDAFAKFWAQRGNYGSFLRDFVAGDSLVYRESLVGNAFHVFPAPGLLVDRDSLLPQYRGVVAERYFPPTTRSLGSVVWERPGEHCVVGLIHTIQADPDALPANADQWEPLTKLPGEKTAEWRRLAETLESSYPLIEAGVIHGRASLKWLEHLYRLQIFLLQPFTGFTRHPLPTGRKGGKASAPHEAPEVVRVLMREPLPTKVPHYVLVTHHPITGQKLEFEVDVRAHERHCASGKVVPVRSHKRGPKGKTREKVIKVVR